MEFINQTFYVIHRDRFMPRPNVAVVLGRWIFCGATAEMERSGAWIEDMLGIASILDAEGDWIGWEREASEAEVFDTCVEKLGDDGRLYEVYRMDQSAEFLASAERHGLLDEAQAAIWEDQP